MDECGFIIKRPGVYQHHAQTRREVSRAASSPSNGYEGRGGVVKPYASGRSPIPALFPTPSNLCLLLPSKGRIPLALSASFPSSSPLAHFCPVYSSPTATSQIKPLLHKLPMTTHILPNLPSQNLLF